MGTSNDIQKRNKMKYLSAGKAIRQKCLDCSNFQPIEVKLCTCPDCPLYPYRMGKSPNRQGIGGNKDFNKKKLT